MVVLGVGQVELAEDAGDVLLRGALADHERRGDPDVGLALGHRGEHLALARRQRRQPVVAPAADHQLGDHLGVERRPAGRHARERVHELAHVRDAVLEQVADAAAAVREQLARVLALDVLAEHEDRGPRHAPSRLDRGPQALVALGRRHADVDDGHVRPVLDDRVDEGRPVADLRHHRCPGVLEQADQALAQQHGVLGDHHPQPGALHGPIMHSAWSGRGARGHVAPTPGPRTIEPSVSARTTR